MNLQAEPLNLKETTVTCIPRLRGGGGGGARRSRRGTAAAATQVSMLDRVRDVVLRLAMLSAASTATTTKGTPVTTTTTTTMRRRPLAAVAVATPSRAAARVSPTTASSVAYTDSYRSEAVDDCIEFLKRSAAGGVVAPVAIAVEATTCHVNQN
jgi:hypothetical protein